MSSEQSEILAWLNHEQKQASRWVRTERGINQFTLTGPELMRIRRALEGAPRKTGAVCPECSGHSGQHAMGCSEADAARPRSQSDDDERANNLREALVAARDALAAFSKQAGWLPEQQGYSATMTDAERKLSQAVSDIDAILGGHTRGRSPRRKDWV